MMQGYRFHWVIPAVLVVLTLTWSTAPSSLHSGGIGESDLPTLTPTATALPETPAPTSTVTLPPTPTGSPTAVPTGSPTPTSIPTVLPSEYALVEVGQIGGAIRGADIVDQYAYVLIGPRLAVLDVSDPANPALIGQSGMLAVPAWYQPGYPWRRLSVVAGYAYVPNGTRGLAIMSVLDPTRPTLEGCYSSPGPVWDVAVAGDLAYVAAGEAGVRILDITNKAQPREAAVYETAGPATVVEVLGNLLCVVEEPGSLHVLDISLPTQPRLLSVYSTGELVCQVVLAGDRAYLNVRYYEYYGVEIIDLSDPSSPHLLSKCSSSLDLHRELGPWNPPPAPYRSHAMAVDGKYLYTTSPGGFHVYDVEDPGNPITVAVHSTEEHYLIGVWVVSRRAYLLQQDPQGAIALCVVDVSNPEALIEHGCYCTYKAGSVCVAWPFAYVREAGGISILSIEDPAQPARVGSYPVDVEPLVVADGYLYALNPSSEGSGLEIIDVRDPQHPSRAEFIPGEIEDVAVSGNLAYIAHRDKLFLIDVTDPYSPTMMGEWGEWGHLWWAYAVEVKGSYAYLGVVESEVAGSLYVLDATDPARPLLSAWIELTSSRNQMVLAGDHLILNDGRHLRILSVADPAHPAQVGSWDTGTYPYLHQVVGSHAYLTDTDGKLILLDVSNPAQPREVLSWTTNESLSDVDSVGDFVYIADSGGGLLVMRLVHIEGRCFLPIITSTD